MLTFLKKWVFVWIIAFYFKTTYIQMRTVISGPSGYKSAVDSKNVKKFKLPPPPTNPSNKSGKLSIYF